MKIPLYFKCAHKQLRARDISINLSSITLKLFIYLFYSLFTNPNYEKYSQIVRKLNIYSIRMRAMMSTQASKKRFIFATKEADNNLLVTVVVNSFKDFSRSFRELKFKRK